MKGIYTNGGRIKMELNLIVLYSSNIKRLRSFYQSLGLKFVEEKPENSSRYYACQLGSLVLELYPARRQRQPSARGAVIGFDVDNLDALMEHVEKEYVHRVPKQSPYVRTAYLYDPDGRKVIVQEKKKE